MGKKISNEARMFGVLPSQGADPIPVGKIPDNATQVVKQGTATNQTVTIHTVTTAKTLYLSVIAHFANNSGGASGTGRCMVTNAADTTQYHFCIILVPDDTGLFGAIPFFPPLEIPAGYKIKAVSDLAGFSFRGFIHGYEI